VNKIIKGVQKMNPFISVGIAIITGILFGKLANKLKIPAVAGYVIAGLIVGSSILNIVDAEVLQKTSFLSDFALGIIAFNIGNELKISVIKKLGKSILIIALFESLTAFIFVTGIMLLLKQGIAASLILGAVSSATAPAATVMVLKEYKAKGPLTTTLLGVVAIDDAICLMIYAVAASVAKIFIKQESITLHKIFILPLLEIILSLVAGIALGILLTYLIKISKKETELLPFTLGTIITLVGIAIKFNLSPLLSAMALGITVVNSSSGSRRAFSAMEHFSPPIIATFFILAGARLDIFLIPKLGLIGFAYLIFRILGKVLGASFGAWVAKSPLVIQKYIGFGLLSQVGVAIGLAILVDREFAGTQLGTLVLTILLATTIITEIIGPISTKNAIIKAKETNS
jgi:Kef-type K+ transport system membrane component KefB